MLGCSYHSLPNSSTENPSPQPLTPGPWGEGWACLRCCFQLPGAHNLLLLQWRHSPWYPGTQNTSPSLQWSRHSVLGFPLQPPFYLPPASPSSDESFLRFLPSVWKGLGCCQGKSVQASTRLTLLSPLLAPSAIVVSPLMLGSRCRSSFPADLQVPGRPGTCCWCRMVSPSGLLSAFWLLLEALPTSAPLGSLELLALCQLLLPPWWLSPSLSAPFLLSSTSVGLPSSRASATPLAIGLSCSTRIMSSLYVNTQICFLSSSPQFPPL